MAFKSVIVSDLTGNTNHMQTTLIVGCGYLGRYCAERLPRETVRTIVASEASASELRHDGYAVQRLDLDSAADPTLPTGAYRLLYLTPPPARGREDPRLLRLLAALRARPPQRIVYASSSAVYGDCQGAWVNEDSPLDPQSDTAARRLHAEAGLACWCAEQRVSHVILRIAGIYGPGRLPLARLRHARPAVREAEAGWSNRIHVVDLAHICLAALQHPSPSPIYNVADKRPTSTTVFLRAVAHCSGLPPLAEVPLAEALRQASPAQRRFLLESRRLDTTRLRAELLPQLRYPDFQQALATMPECAAASHRGISS